MHQNLDFCSNTNQHVYQTAFKGAGTYWYFNNGQFGERVENTYRYEYALNYFYDRVYLITRTRHTDAWGPCSNVSQRSLAGVTDPEILHAARLIFDADKAAGLVPDGTEFR